MKTIEELKELFSELPSVSQTQLLDELLADQELKGKILTEAKQKVLSVRKKKPCPYCKSSKVYKRGIQKGTQMYQCRECTKWYSETTGTPLYDIKLKSKWQSYLRCMEKGMSIKDIAKQLGISIQTSFDWRHKILSSLSECSPEKISGEAECDELELAISNKGERNLNRNARKRGNDFKRNGEGEVPTVVQIVTAVERNGAKYLKAVESKRLSKVEIAKVLDDKLTEQTILITDKHPSYKAFAKDHPEIKHKTVLAKDHVNPKDKTVHLQKVNNTHAQLRKFLQPFNGVSTKYLQNYLNWFAYTKQIKSSKKTLRQWFITILLSEGAYELFLLFKQNAVLIRT